MPNLPYQPSDFSGLFRPVISTPISPPGNNNTVIYVIAGVVVVGLVAYGIYQVNKNSYIIEKLDKQSEENIALRKTLLLQLAAQNSRATQVSTSLVNGSDTPVKS